MQATHSLALKQYVCDLSVKCLLFKRIARYAIARLLEGVGQGQTKFNDCRFVVVWHTFSLELCSASCTISNAMWALTYLVETVCEMNGWGQRHIGITQAEFYFLLMVEL
jgi:hypothetical protein